jgi:hypothetical protein
MATTYPDVVRGIVAVGHTSVPTARTIRPWLHKVPLECGIGISRI